MKKILIKFLSLIIISSLALTGCQTKTGGTLKVGVRNDIHNFSYYNNKSNDYYGLEDDIARELASRMSYNSVEFVTVNPENREQALSDGKVDCLIATYSNTPTRLKTFDFSDTYYQDKSVLMVENSSMIKKGTDLKNHTVGIMKGSNTGSELVARLKQVNKIDDKVLEETNEYTKYKDFTIKNYNSYSELSDGLEVGEVDAAAMDGCIAHTYSHENRTILDFEISNQNYAVATQKNSELSGKVKTNIKSMLDDGTIDKLIDKWN